MIALNENVLVIKPTNAKPQGFMLYFAWAMLGLSIATIPVFVGLFLIWIPILFLFFVPRKYERDMPMSMVLYEDRLQTYTWHGKESWSVPWEDIDKIYLISTHWAMPRNIGLRLHRHDRFRASVEQAQKEKSAFQQKISRFGTSKAMIFFSRMLIKSEVGITNQCLDRPAPAFAELLYSYMEMDSVRKLNSQKFLEEVMDQEINGTDLSKGKI
jgi:hypothetical protein